MGEQPIRSRVRSRVRSFMGGWLIRAVRPLLRSVEIEEPFQSSLLPTGSRFPRHSASETPIPSSLRATTPLPPQFAAQPNPCRDRRKLILRTEFLASGGTRIQQCIYSTEFDVSPFRHGGGFYAKKRIGIGCLLICGRSVSCRRF